MLRKTFVWHIWRVVLAIAAFASMIAMIMAIAFVTFTLYVLTSAHHLLSLPGMAILACAVVLMARDEISYMIESAVWSRVQAGALLTCISGHVENESGWLLVVESKDQQRGLQRVRQVFSGYRRPVRVLRVIASDGDDLYIGWDCKSFPLQSNGQVKWRDGRWYTFSKHMFPTIR